MGYVGSIIEPVIDPIAAQVQSFIESLASRVQPIVDPLSPRVESIIDPVATRVQSAVDAVAEPIEEIIGRTYRHRAANYQRCQTNHDGLFHGDETPCLDLSMRLSTGWTRPCR
ncbi:MAG: hypothetical protein ACREP3_16520 [Candidatus Binatia bacterium]